MITTIYLMRELVAGKRSTTKAEQSLQNLLGLGYSHHHACYAVTPSKALAVAVSYLSVFYFLLSWQCCVGGSACRQPYSLNPSWLPCPFLKTSQGLHACHEENVVILSQKLLLLLLARKIKRMRVLTSRKMGHSCYTNIGSWRQ